LAGDAKRGIIGFDSGDLKDARCARCPSDSRWEPSMGKVHW